MNPEEIAADAFLAAADIIDKVLVEHGVNRAFQGNPVALKRYQSVVGAAVLEAQLWGFRRGLDEGGVLGVDPVMRQIRRALETEKQGNDG